MEADGLVKAKTGVLAGAGPSLWSLLVVTVADEEVLKAGRDDRGSSFLVVNADTWPDTIISTSMKERKVRMVPRRFFNATTTTVKLTERRRD